MFVRKISFIVLSLGALALAGCSDESETRQISYKQDVMPILAARCLECHVPGAKGEKASGFMMNTYESLMKGTKHGPVIVPGNSLVSVFNQVVEGRVDKSIAMPHGGAQIPAEEVMVLKAWVDQGAKNN